MRLSLPQKLIAGILVLAFLVQAINYFQPPTVVGIEPQVQGLVKVNYLAPKVVLAQTATNNKLIKLSCPWTVGPKILGTQSGGTPPILTVANAVGSCAPATCQSINRVLAVNYCIPLGVDIPIAVIPVSNYSISGAPIPPVYHYVGGGNATDYFHKAAGSDASPYVPGGNTPGGGGTPNAGGNGSGGISIQGAACDYHTESPGPGQSGPVVKWCGGSCPSGSTCRQTGYAPPSACECRPTQATGSGADYPVVSSQGFGGPIYAGTYSSSLPPGGEAGSDPDTGIIVGQGISSTSNGFASNPNNIPLANFAAPPNTGSSGFNGGLYTPDTWWFATVGICVNVCK